ncbi:MAG: dodecin family protein [Candidatus Thermoplasmatota archaeon]|jgi:flavin-binding protein dodecin|nr:dodecin family protein [Candidatus Thermoplasmatota archaeon]MCL5962764.1 dodecin family protein [Candidatus Thermoplasmatota archaeon]
MVQKVIEIVGVSHESLKDAIDSAIVTAGKSVRNIRWFHVESIDGEVKTGNAHDWRVTLKIYFDVE